MLCWLIATLLAPEHVHALFSWIVSTNVVVVLKLFFMVNLICYMIDETDELATDQNGYVVVVPIL